MGIAAIISIGQLAGIFATAPAIAADGDLSWKDRNQVQAEVSRLDREITTNPNEPDRDSYRISPKTCFGNSQSCILSLGFDLKIAKTSNFKTGSEQALQYYQSRFLH
jgi:hypothetical protein